MDKILIDAGYSNSINWTSKKEIIFKNLTRDHLNKISFPDKNRRQKKLSKLYAAEDNTCSNTPSAITKDLL